jgi:hypothetical protein
MLHMMFKLGQCAEQNWRKLRGFDYLAKVITGVTFKDGIETTETGQISRMTNNPQTPDLTITQHP